MAALAQKIVPHLWYVSEAEEAVRFYAALFPNSSVDHVSKMPVDTPAGPPGSVTLVDFTLCGQKFHAIAAGPLDPFNHAISFMVLCDDQAEVDKFWAALKDGGQEEQCGWIRDRWGLCWQITPRDFMRMASSPDKAAVARVMAAMLQMVKFDIAALERAFKG
jgi:predicted 3-demethylubiquinone-9 3-methyltransferase (glyoxalase superfamily)